MTVALLDANAVVGLTGHRDQDRRSRSRSVSSARSVIRRWTTPWRRASAGRLDGWPNRDLNVGAIVALAPDLSAVADLLQTDQQTVRKVLNSWGPGKFDAQLFLDGKAFRPDGKSAATLLPAAFGLAGVNLHTYTGWGGVSHWNAFVANLEMHGKGTFIDARLDDPLQFPVAARAGFGHVRSDPDLITSKLPALQFYQLSIPAPDPARGNLRCAAPPGPAGRCSTGPLAARRATSRRSSPSPAGTCTRPRKSASTTSSPSRSPDQRYRTTPLAGLFTRQKGGFYHDGRFANLRAVVEHYNQALNLNLGEQAKRGSYRVPEIVVAVAAARDQRWTVSVKVWSACSQSGSVVGAKATTSCVCSENPRFFLTPTSITPRMFTGGRPKPSSVDPAHS